MDLRLLNGSFDLLHFFQNLDTALSLAGRLLVVPVPVYESFELSDPLLLVFVCRQAHFHALCFLLEVKIITAGIFFQRSLLDFDYTLYRFVEKDAVVRDQDKSRSRV
jgi:hypothetical protein